MEVGTISSASDRDIRGGQKKRELINQKGLLIYNPNTIICEAQAKKLE